MNMKSAIIKTLTVVSVIAMLATGCKKEDTNTKTYLITAIADSAGVDQTTFEYDASDKLIRLGSSPTDFYNFFYSGSKLTVRNIVSSGTVQKVDSFFYDASNHIVRVEGYNGTGTKQKTTVFAYNGNGTINSATVDYVDPLTDDEMHEYTYNGDNVNTRTSSVKQLGVYKLKTKLEYLGVDDKTNPFVSLYRNHVPDEFSIFFFIWSGVNNPTSAKQTDYDVTTGNVTQVTSATVSYEYNSGNVPTKLTNTVGAQSQKMTFKYLEK